MGNTTASSVFRFDSYTIAADRRTLHFDYSILLPDGTTHTLSEQLVLPLPIPGSPTPAVTKLLEALHIGLGISYYKVFLPPTFELPYALSTTAAAFWNTVYQNGLGEFLYLNQLSPDRLAVFAANDMTAEAPAPSDLQPAALLGIGGGKDSIVAYELLKKAGVPMAGFVLATGTTHGQAESVAQTMNLDLLRVERYLDPALHELTSRPGAYNGHVPISMIFALTGSLLSLLSGQAYTSVANEAAASEFNTVWQGMTINHQWSKSLEFEKLYQQFVTETVHPGLKYFSPIRNLSSVAVAKLFSRYPQYFDSFTSCNLVFRIDPAKRPNGRWCGECPKCLSSFILLSAWLDEKTVIDIFSKNMLDDGDLEPLLLELTGREGHKPLDCVGTVEEIVLSLNLAAEAGKFADTKLMQLAREKGVIYDGNWQKQLEEALQPAPDHAIPAELATKLDEVTRHGL